MAPYTGKERRENADIIMLLGEIQKIAVIAAETRTSVYLLRRDVSEMKKSTASCSDLERVETSLENHKKDHKEVSDQARETRRWAIGTIIAAGIGALSFVGSFFQNSGTIPKIP